MQLMQVKVLFMMSSWPEKKFKNASGGFENE